MLVWGSRISEMRLPAGPLPAVSVPSAASGILRPPGLRAALLPDLPGPLAPHSSSFLTGPCFVCLPGKSAGTTEAGPLVHCLTWNGTCTEQVLTEQSSVW